MNKIIKKYTVRFVLYLLNKSLWFRHFILLNANNKFFFGASISKIKLVEGKEKTRAFKKLNRLYRKRKYTQYIQFLNAHERWIIEGRRSKYFSWAALIAKGTLQSKEYIGEAVSIHPIAINDITTSIIISEYPQKTEIEEYLKNKALSSEYITQLIYCYVIAKFDGLEYLASLSCKPGFLTQLNYKEKLELYSLLNDFQQVVLLYEYNKNKIFTLKCYERIYDAYTRLGQLSLAQEVFLEADELYAGQKSTFPPGVNLHAINNKLERHFWFAKGDLVRAYHTYKRQRLSQILFVSFGSQYSQKLKDIIDASSPLVLASWGPGDEIRFSCLYHLLNKINSSITISCEPRLYDLLSQRFPEVNFIPVNRARRVSNLDATKYSQLPHAKLHHLMDNKLLSKLHKFDKVTILTDILSELFDDYLQSQQATYFKLPPSGLRLSVINEVRQLRAINKTLIGLSWRSSVETISRNEHYFQLSELVSLLKLKNVVFVNLQYGDCNDEVKRLKNDVNFEFVNVNIDQFNDFSSVCYVMQNLDVIVSAGTTVLELAGLSGSTTFALTNHPAFKSRVQKGNHDLWFPNIKYIDDMTHLNKIEVVAEIAKRIEALDGGD